MKGTAPKRSGWWYHTFLTCLLQEHLPDMLQEAHASCSTIHNNRKTPWSAFMIQQA
jgi:hypothetical protein